MTIFNFPGRSAADGDRPDPRWAWLGRPLRCDSDSKSRRDTRHAITLAALPGMQRWTARPLPAELQQDLSALGEQERLSALVWLSLHHHAKVG